MKILFLEALPSSEQNYFTAKVKGDYKKTEQLFSELANELKFPDYFGNNWNALYDCLCDFHWIKEKKIILVHEGIPNIEKKEFGTYLKILLEASSGWKSYEEHILEIIFLNLTENEKIFIRIFIAYVFLLKMDYTIKNLSIYGKDLYIRYYSKLNKREVLVELDEANNLFTQIKRREILNVTNINNIFNIYDLAQENEEIIPINIIENKLDFVLEKNVSFMKDKLLDIINGKEWIKGK